MSKKCIRALHNRANMQGPRRGQAAVPCVDSKNRPGHHRRASRQHVGTDFDDKSCRYLVTLPIALEPHTMSNPEDEPGLSVAMR